MRQEPTTDELPIAGQTVELPDGKTTELPVTGNDRDTAGPPERRTVKLSGEGFDPAAVQDGPTAELPAAQQQAPGRHRPETVQQVRRDSPEPRKRSRFWRELAGALAAGTVLLAAAVLVLQVVAWVNGMPGLGVVVLLGHLGGAALAVAAQRIVDRREGRPALLAGLGLGVIVAAILVLFWWI